MTLKKRLKVVLSETVFHKIRFLCDNINTVEWSGCMFYDIQGSINDPSNIKITVLDLIPLDRGTTGFTEYTFDHRVMEYMMEKDYFHLKIGHKMLCPMLSN